MSLSFNQASGVALLNFIVGQVVAFVPSAAPYQQLAISLGTTAISAVYLVVHAIHARTHAQVKAAAPPAPLQANL